MNAEIDYYYYDGDPLQNPGSGSEGITGIPSNDENTSCSPNPCEYPCSNGSVVNEWKEDFYQHRQEWLTKKANLPNISDSLQLEAEKDTILYLRLVMNQDASRVLRQYSLDTTTIEVDTILAWLALAETYPADLRLERHHFFTQDYASFGTLWQSLPAKHGLTGNPLDEYNELELVYDLVRPHLQFGGTLYDFPQATLDSLRFWGDWCSEPGFLAQSLLSRNGIFMVSDCSLGMVQRAVAEGKNEERIFKNENIKVYPNPTSDEIIVEFPRMEVGIKLAIFNVQGKLVKSQLFDALSLKVNMDVRGLPSGLYFLHVQSNHSSSCQTKILIQH